MADNAENENTPPHTGPEETNSPLLLATSQIQRELLNNLHVLMAVDTDRV